MKIRNLIALALTGYTFVQSPEPFPPADPASQGINPASLARLSEMVEGFVDSGWVIGAELLVIRNQRTVLHQVYGMRDVENELQMERGTLFNLRSMAKPIVGSIALRLVDNGSIFLNDPVSSYLPSFGEGASAGITIEHLLTHSSGLPDGNPAGRPSDYPTLRSIADYWGRHGPTEFSPGDGFLYSDPGADVLGAVMEVVAGLPLHELADREVFEPLGMTCSTGLLDDEFIRDHRFASVYQPTAQGSWRQVWSPERGSIVPFTIGSGTTWYASPMDYAHLIDAWVNEGRVASWQWISGDLVGDALKPRSSMAYANQVPNCKVRYGQMWQVYVRSGEDGREVPVAFGHSGSDGTYSWVWPEHDLMVLYFTQSRGQRTRLLLEPFLEELVTASK